jgi:hypothetical protein
VYLEEESGLREDVGSKERSTLSGPGSIPHLTRMHMASTGGAHGGYDREKCTQKIQRSSRLDRHQGYAWC